MQLYISSCWYFQMVFLPEAFDFIGESKEETFKLAEPLDGHLISNFKELAKSNKVWLSLGGAHVKVSQGLGGR